MRVTRVTVGLLKEPQKFQIHFLELHVDLSIVDNPELQRAEEPCARLVLSCCAFARLLRMKSRGQKEVVTTTFAPQRF